MALNPSTYPPFVGRVNAPDAEYNYGSAVDQSLPGVNDGTPFIEGYVNDDWGFKQALLNDAAIVPNGDPDTITNSQYLQALKVIATNQQGLPPGYILGLDTSAAGNLVTINPGRARSDDILFDIISPSAITKNIGLDWAEGDGLGGFPSGIPFLPGVWYAYYLLLKNDGVTIDGGWDLVGTTANLLADATDYVATRRIAFHLNEAGTIMPYSQIGNDFIPASVDALSVTGANDTVPQPLTLNLPVFNMPVQVMHSIDDFGSSTTRIIATLYQEFQDNLAAVDINTNATAHAGNDTGINLNERGWNWFDVFSGQSNTVFYKVNATPQATSSHVTIKKWVDYRGSIGPDNPPA